MNAPHTNAPMGPLAGRAARRLLQRAMVTALIVVQSACGFQLQGRTILPVTLVSAVLEVPDEQSDFAQGLRRALADSGAVLQRGVHPDAVVIRILSDQVTEKVISVSAGNIPREYELTYQVQISVTQGEKELLTAEDLSVSREFSFDERQELAKQREKEVLRTALAQDLVGRVMRRLASL